MQKFSRASIGTHLWIFVRTEVDLSRQFGEIISFLEDFERKFSRFKKYNWLYFLNQNKTAQLDKNAFKMLFMMQKIARESD